jgi:hypothetical protein
VEALRLSVCHNGNNARMMKDGGDNEKKMRKRKTRIIKPLL